MVPHTSRYALKKFLATNAKNPSLIAPALSLIEPFFVIAESGTYPLSPAKDLDSEESARAITRAVAVGDEDFDDVDKAVFVSAPQDRPLKDLADEITGLRFHLRMRLVDVNDNIEEELTDEIRDCLMDYGVMNALGTRYGLEQFNSDLMGLYWIIGGCLYTYLAFVILDRIKEAEEFVPLIRLLPKAIPLGKKKGESGTWIVLAAP